MRSSHHTYYREVFGSSLVDSSSSDGINDSDDDDDVLRKQRQDRKAAKEAAAAQANASTEAELELERAEAARKQALQDKVIALRAQAAAAEALLQMGEDASTWSQLFSCQLYVILCFQTQLSDVPSR